MVTGQSLRYRLDNSRDFAGVRPLLSNYKSRILNLIRAQKLEQKIRAIGPINQFFAISKDVIAKDLHQRPNALTSLQAYVNEFGIELTPSEVLILFPEQARLSDDLTFYPVSNSDNQILSFSETTILTLLIRGIGNAVADNAEANYIPTAKCLLNSTLTSKMALHQVLRGSTKIDFAGYGNSKACGNITLNEMGRAYLKYHGAASINMQKKTALSRALPDISNSLKNLNSGFMTMMETRKLRAGDAYLHVYLGNIALRQEDFAADDVSELTKHITKNVDGVLARIDRDYALSNSSLVWEDASLQKEVAKLLRDCKLNFSINDTTAFFEVMTLNEKVGFYSGFTSQIARSSINFADVSEGFLREVILNALYTARLKSSVDALRIGLAEIENPDQVIDTELSIQEFIDDVLEPYVRSQTLERASQYRPFIDNVISRYRRELLTIEPFGAARTPFVESLIKSSATLVKYDNPHLSFAEMPFRQSIMLAIYQNKVRALSPAARELAKVIFDADYEKAIQYWKQTNTFFREDAAELRIGDRVYVRKGKSIAPVNRPELKLIQSDFQNLKYLAERLGYSNHETQPKNVQDVMLEIRQDYKSNAQMKEFSALYRNHLKNEIFAQYRLLELPKGDRKFYQDLYNKTSTATGSLINSALVKVQSNLANHIKRVVNAKTTEDLKDYIARSEVLNVLLGEEDLYAVALRNDFFPSIQGVGNSITAEVFPSLLDYHYKVKAKFLNREDFRRELWDEFYDTIGIAVFPLMGAWGLKTFMPYLPRAFGGAWLPSRLTVLADRTAVAVDAYWSALIGFIGVNVPVQGGRILQANSDIRNVEHLYYTEASNVGMSLVSEELFHIQLDRYESRRSNAAVNAGMSAAFFALPFVSVPVMRYYYGTVRPKSIAKKQAHYEKLRAEGKTSQAINLENAHTASFVREFARKAKVNDIYFKHLGVEPGTWSVTRLSEALKKMQVSNDAAQVARAKYAYEKLINEMATRLYSVQSSRVLKNAFIRALWNSEDEAIRLAQAFDDINGLGK